MQFQSPPSFSFGAATPPRPIQPSRPSLKRGTATFLDTTTTSHDNEEDQGLSGGGAKKRRISPTSAFSKLRISPPRPSSGMFVMGDGAALPFASDSAQPSFFTPIVTPQVPVPAPFTATQAPFVTNATINSMPMSTPMPAPVTEAKMHTPYTAYEIAPDRIYVESLSSSPSSANTPVEETPPTNPHFQTLNLNPQVAAHLQKTFENPWVPRDYSLAPSTASKPEMSVVRYGVHTPWTGARSARDEAEVYEKAWRDYMLSREAIESAAAEEPERFVELAPGGDVMHEDAGCVGAVIAQEQELVGAGEADGMDLDP